MGKCYGSVSTYRDSRMQLMRLAPHGHELGARGSAIGRLVESPLTERQGLIASDDGTEFGHGRDRTRLFARKRQRDLGRAAGHTLLDCALVEMRGPRLDRNPRGFKQRTAHFALRSKHKRLFGQPESSSTQDACCRRRSASSAITAAAVSSIERRVTSMIGQLCRAHSLRENAISSATAWRST